MKIWSKNDHTKFNKERKHRINGTIIVTKADKREAVVIMVVDEYTKEVEWQLNNQEHYKKLKEDPAETNSKPINDAIHRFKENKFLKIAEDLKIAGRK